MALGLLCGCLSPKNIPANPPTQPVAVQGANASTPAPTPALIPKNGKNNAPANTPNQSAAIQGASVSAPAPAPKKGKKNAPANTPNQPAAVQGASTSAPTPAPAPKKGKKSPPVPPPKEYPQFRILLIGKANSGKTTIVKKMCDTSVDPIVRDENGNQVPVSDSQNPTALRGIHDIRHAITCPNNPNFIFHDAMGFEAGTTSELDTVKAFILESLQKPELHGRLHAIWYCIPTDSTRVASKEELSFFNQNIGVPIIILFTKWDGLVIQNFSKLRNEKGMSVDAARQEANKSALAALQESFIPVVTGTPHPPVSYAVLGDMDKPETKCDELAERTAAALSTIEQKKLFVSIQTQDLGLCAKHGINEVVSKYIFPGASKTSFTPEFVMRLVLSWFPHIYWSVHEYSDDREKVLLGKLREFPIVGLFQPIVKGSKKTFKPPRLQALNNAACAAIIGIHSFDLKRTGKIDDAVKTSVTKYLASPQYKSVEAAVTTKFGQYAKSKTLPGDTVKQITEDLVKICLGNLPS